MQVATNDNRVEIVRRQDLMERIKHLSDKCLSDAAEHGVEIKDIGSKQHA